MGTFGKKLHGTCFGCAATCAMQKISGVRLEDVEDGKEERAQDRWRSAMLKDSMTSFEAITLLERLETWYDGFRHGGWAANDRVGAWANRRLPERVSDFLLKLPKLTDDLTEVQLAMYENAATLLEAEEL